MSDDVALLEPVGKLVREVGARELLPRFERCADLKKWEKAPGHLVTEADLAAEEALARGLKAIRPDAVVVGEEGVADDPGLVDALGEAHEAWLLDPLDGTTNFAEGVPVFTVIVALVRDGRTVAGWLHDPVAGTLVSAAAGEGAWADGGRRLRLAPARGVEQMRGAIYARPGRPGITADIKAKRRRFGAPYRRCAGHEHLSLVLGDLDFALFSRLMPWDHAAGVLIHGEAGGYARCLDRTPYRPTRRVGNLLLAPDGESWEALRALFADEAA